MFTFAETFGLLAQSFMGPLIFLIVIVVVVIAASWKIYEKAGQAGWKSLVPIYNTYVLTCPICGRSTGWFILMLIPIVNLIPALAAPFDIAKSYGKGTGFGLGLLFLPMIFFPVLAFGDARYVGPAAAPMMARR